MFFIKFSTNEIHKNNFIKFKNFLNFHSVLKFKKFNSAALITAAEKGNLELIKLLLSHPKININILYILNTKIFNKITSSHKKEVFQFNNLNTIFKDDFFIKFN